jgi:hypothetical protein
MSIEKNRAQDKKDKRAGKQKGSAEFVGFFTVSLSEEDKEILEAESGQAGDMGEMLLDLVSEGMKVSFILAKGEASTMCSVYCSRVGAVDEGRGYSSWGATPLDALVSAHYKLRHVLGDMSFAEYEAAAVSRRTEERFS